MTSKYYCFVCRDNGFPAEEITFGGKNSAGKTIVMNPDKTSHQHKEKQQQEIIPIQTQDNKVSSVQGKDEKVVPDQIQTDSQLVEILRQIKGLETKIDHLTRLVYSQTQKQEQQLQSNADEHYEHNNPYTLLDNR